MVKKFPWIVKAGNYVNTKTTVDIGSYWGFIVLSICLYVISHEKLYLFTGF